VVALRRGAEELGIDSRLDQFANDDTAMVLAFTRSYANSDENKNLLADTRDYQVGGDMAMLVDGGTAEIVDVVDAMYGQFPKAIALIVVATYIVLLVLFRAVLLPLKAIVMNTLSIMASYGALVWIFQDGHLSSILRFEPLGFVEASLPIIMFCVLFGLSMDYEVFLLSRVREEWDRTGDNTRSVAIGLQRSGRIITSAALIVVVVTASFVSADVILIKALGLGIALAVFLDATIVRALLVPATMRLLGHWNWWMPAALHRVLPAHSLVDESGDRITVH
jgi:RND superfamily putative drug exporter